MLSVANKLEFADWLSQELLNRGWTQSDLAAIAGLNRASISHIINRSRLPGPEIVVKIALAFGYPPEDVFRVAGLLPKKNEAIEPPGLGEWIQRYLDASEDERQEMLEQISRRLRQKIEQGSPAEVKAILGGLIERISIERDGRQLLGYINYFHPGLAATDPKVKSGLR